MTILLIILLICLVIYLYYRQRKLAFDADNSATNFTENNQTELTQIKQANQALVAFLRTQLNSNSLEELKSKLADKTLDELIEENSDWESEVDNLTRTKNSLEADLLAQSNAFQSRIKEKDREVKKLKEDLAEEKKRVENSQQKLTSEKAQHKGSLERIGLLSKQIQDLTKQHTEQLRAINLLFDEKAEDYEEIDFNGLYELLKKMAHQDLPGSFPREDN